MTAAPDLRAPDWLAALQGLLPRGAAWPRQPDAVQAGLLRGLSQRLEALHARTRDLSERESDPAATQEMLADWERAFGLPDDAAPNSSFSRASAATYFDAGGTLRTAAVNQPRYSYDPVTGLPAALLLEPAATNGLPNPFAEGAVAGTPGTAPTNGWAIVPQAGIASQIVGRGTEAGIPWIEVRFFGTAASTNFSRVYFSGNSVPALVGAAGQVWTLSAFLALSAGSLSGVGPALYLEEFAGTTYLRQWLKAVAIGAGPLAGRRPSLTATIANAATTRLRSILHFTIAAGTVVDFTVRIGWPQAETGPRPTTPIGPAPGAPAAATRAADLYYVKPVADRQAALQARITALGGQSRAYYIGVAARLGYAITITEFRPARAGSARAGDRCYGRAWGFVWRVNAPPNTFMPARAGRARAGDRVLTWGNTSLEAVLTRLKPAHTTLILAYG